MVFYSSAVVAARAGGHRIHYDLAHVESQLLAYQPSEQQLKYFLGLSVVVAVQSAISAPLTQDSDAHAEDTWTMRGVKALYYHENEYDMLRSGYLPSFVRYF